MVDNESEAGAPAPSGNSGAAGQLHAPPASDKREEVHPSDVIVHGHHSTSKGSRERAYIGGIDESEGVQATIERMRAQPGSATVHEEGCRALENLVQPRNKNIVADEGGIEVIVKGMNEHVRSSGVQTHGCLALGHLGVGNPESTTKIIKEGGIQAIISSMDKHQDSADVQTAGCRALLDLACPPFPKVRALMKLISIVQAKISKEGGIKTIVKGMVAHKDNVHVQTWGCRALRGLAWNFAANKAAIVEEDGVEVL